MSITQTPFLRQGRRFSGYAERSQQAAIRFTGELNHARQRVISHPLLGGAYFHGTRCLKLRRYPYGFIYIKHGEKIVGIAVAHLKHKPGYWKHRLTQ